MPQQTIAIIGSQDKTGFLFTVELLQHIACRLLLLMETEESADTLFRALIQQKPEREPEKVFSLRDGCWEADIIVLNTTPGSAKAVADQIREVSIQKIVFVLSPPEQNRPAAVRQHWIWQDLLPNSKVVVALNGLNRVETLLAGKDEEAVHIISGIVFQAGFHPRISGK